MSDPARSEATHFSRPPPPPVGMWNGWTNVGAVMWKRVPKLAGAGGVARSDKEGAGRSTLPKEWADIILSCEYTLRVR